MLEKECPHCNHRMSFFSKTLNTGDKQKACPECNGRFTVNFDYKKMAKIAIPIILVMAVVVTALTFPQQSSSPISLLVMVIPGLATGYFKSMSLKAVEGKSTA